MTRLVIIDDDSLVEVGIGTVLRLKGFDVVGTACDIDRGIASVLELRPDVVVCDVMLHGEPAGLDMPSRLAQTAAAGTPVILLSSFAPPHLVRLARVQGAAGYLAKDTDLETLVGAIRIVQRGGEVFPAPATGERSPSPRETQIVRALADGLSSDEAGSRLGISGRTVDTHVARLFERYEIHTRTELVVLAIKRGWIVELPGTRPAEGR